MHDPQSSTNDHAERLAGFSHRRFSGQGQTVVRQRGGRFVASLRRIGAKLPEFAAGAEEWGSQGDGENEL